MAEPRDTAPRPRRKRAGRWVLVTFLVLLALQTAGPLTIVVSEGLAASFDWAGFIGYSLGSVAFPMAFGCLGLLSRKRPGFAFFAISLIAFLILEAASIAGSIQT